MPHKNYHSPQQDKNFSCATSTYTQIITAKKIKNYQNMPTPTPGLNHIENILNTSRTRSHNIIVLRGERGGYALEKRARKADKNVNKTLGVNDKASRRHSREANQVQVPACCDGADEW